MEDFPSDLEWKLQSLLSPTDFSGLLAFFFFFQKATKLTYLLGTPQRVCCHSPAAWHSALLSGREPRTLKNPCLCPGFPAPNPSSGSLKTAVSTFGTQSSGGERGSLVSPCVNCSSQHSCAQCYSPGVSEKGILQLDRQGLEILGTSNHRLA